MRSIVGVGRLSEVMATLPPSHSPVQQKSHFYPHAKPISDLVNTIHMHHPSHIAECCAQAWQHLLPRRNLLDNEPAALCASFSEATGVASSRYFRDFVVAEERRTIKSAGGAGAPGECSSAPF